MRCNWGDPSLKGASALWLRSPATNGSSNVQAGPEGLFSRILTILRSHRSVLPSGGFLRHSLGLSLLLASLLQFASCAGPAAGLPHSQNGI